METHINVALIVGIGTFVASTVEDQYFKIVGVIIVMAGSILAGYYDCGVSQSKSKENQK